MLRLADRGYNYPNQKVEQSTLSEIDLVENIWLLSFHYLM